MTRVPHLLAAVALAATTLTTLGLAAPADAVTTHYSSCAKLTKKFPHGVATSAAAARKQVRLGYGRPSTTKLAKKVYKANKSRLDRDHDGTACER